MAVGGEQTYASVAPEILAVSSTEITLAWSAPVDTGKSPVTGYHVYMFDGVGLNSQADPQPVKHEIQVISTTISSVRLGSCRLFSTDISPQKRLGLPRRKLRSPQFSDSGKFEAPLSMLRIPMEHQSLG